MLIAPFAACGREAGNQPYNGINTETSYGEK